MANYTVTSQYHTPLRLRIEPTPQNPDPMPEVILPGVAPRNPITGAGLGNITTQIDAVFFDQWLLQNVNYDVVTNGLISWS